MLQCPKIHPWICATVYSPPPPFRDRKCATVSTFRTAPPKKLKKWGQLFVIGVVCPNPPTHYTHTHTHTHTHTQQKNTLGTPAPPSQVGGLHPRLPTLSPHIHTTPSLSPFPLTPQHQPPAKGRLTILNSLNSKKENPVLLLWGEGGWEGERAVSSMLRGSSQPERVPLNPIYFGRSTPARIE